MHCACCCYSWSRSLVPGRAAQWGAAGSCECWALAAALAPPARSWARADGPARTAGMPADENWFTGAAPTPEASPGRAASGNITISMGQLHTLVAGAVRETTSAAAPAAAAVGEAEQKSKKNDNDRDEDKSIFDPSRAAAPAFWPSDTRWKKDDWQADSWDKSVEDAWEHPSSWG
eukprot:2898101-Pyramimonas_sp.AAC.1